MKIKGSAKKSDTKKLILTATVLFGLLFVLRVYQLACLTDPATGFFTDHSNITVPIFYVFSIGSVFAVLIVGFLSRVGNGEVQDRRDVLHAITSLLFAIPLVREGVSGVVKIAEYSKSFLSLKNAVSAMGGYIYVVAPVFAMLAAVMLTVNGVSFLTGKTVIRRLKILSLCPAVWAFFLTIGYFKITSSYVKVTHLMLTIFADAFLMIFLFEYARFISGIGIKDAMWSFYATGLIAVGLIAATELPNLFFKLFMPEKIIVDCEFGLYNLFGAFFVITAMRYAKKTGVAE